MSKLFFVLSIAAAVSFEVGATQKRERRQTPRQMPRQTQRQILAIEPSPQTEATRFNYAVNSYNLDSVLKFIHTASERGLKSYSPLIHLKQVVDEGYIGPNSPLYSQENFESWQSDGGIDKSAYQKIALCFADEKLHEAMDISKKLEYYVLCEKICLENSIEMIPATTRMLMPYLQLPHLKQVVDEAHIAEDSHFYSQENWNLWQPGCGIKKSVCQEITLSLINKKIINTKIPTEANKYSKLYQQVSSLKNIVLTALENQLLAFCKAININNNNAIYDLLEDNGFVAYYVPALVLKSALAGDIKDTFLCSQKSFNNWHAEEDGIDKMAFLNMALELIGTELAIGTNHELGFKLNTVYSQLHFLR